MKYISPEEGTIPRSVKQAIQIFNKNFDKFMEHLYYDHNKYHKKKYIL